MTGRWKVCKRDGVWCAIDDEGDLRYAADNWQSVYTFAQLGADRTGWNPQLDRAVIAAIIRARFMRLMWFGPDESDNK